MKKCYLISLLILALLALGAVSAADNSTTLIDEKTFDDIQASISQAGVNSTITLNGTYTGNGREISIEHDLTIEGADDNTTLDADYKSRIFNIHSGNVILKNLNLINGKSETNGGAITSNSHITLINCRFINNTVSFGHEDDAKKNFDLDYDFDNMGMGGAVNANGDATIINSTFRGNSAYLWATYREMEMYYAVNEGQGGAIHCKGDLNIDKTCFSYNSPSGIHCRNSRIANCMFENQSSSFLMDGDSSAVFINSSFNNCGSYASQSEIAIEYGHYSTLLISNCNFTNNKNGLMRIYPEGDICITNCLFLNNTFEYSSYAVTLIEVDKYANITHSTFINNTVKDTAILDLKKYGLTNCTFKNNMGGSILSNGLMLDDNLNPIYLYKIKIRNKFTSTYYKSGKKIIIDLINLKTNELYWDWDIDVYRNGKYFADYWFYNSRVFPVSEWKVGTYKIVIKPCNSFTTPKELSFTVKITKAKTSVKAPKITAKYKKSKYFKITVKSNKKAVKKLLLKVKIGKKTYKIKTDSKGIAKFNTKKLKKGTYKVKITSGNTNYAVSKTSTIKIKR